MLESHTICLRLWLVGLRSSTYAVLNYYHVYMTIMEPTPEHSESEISKHHKTPLLSDFPFSFPPFEIRRAPSTLSLLSNFILTILRHQPLPLLPSIILCRPSKDTHKYHAKWRRIEWAHQSIHLKITVVQSERTRTKTRIGTWTRTRTCRSHCPKI